MGEDLGFNITLLFGCLVGAITGYHVGGITLAVDGSFIGFAAGAALAAFLAELSDALWKLSRAGAWLLTRASPLVALGVLVAGAARYWT